MSQRCGNGLLYTDTLSGRITSYFHRPLCCDFLRRELYRVPECINLFGLQSRVYAFKRKMREQ